MFIRYALDNNVSHFLVVNSEISEISNTTIIEGRDIVYFEKYLFFQTRVPSDSFSTPFTSDAPSSS